MFVRTLATWGGSTQCPLGDYDEDYPSELAEHEDEDEDEEEGAESSSTDEPHSYSNRKPCSSGKNRNRCAHTHFRKCTPLFFFFVCLYVAFLLHNHSLIIYTGSLKGSSSHCTRSRPFPSSKGAKRQENLRWAAELSASESATNTHTHWQEQTTQLQRQLNFSTAMCQMLLQDQQVH